MKMENDQQHKKHTHIAVFCDFPMFLGPDPRTLLLLCGHYGYAAYLPKGVHLPLRLALQWSKLLRIELVEA